MGWGGIGNWFEIDHKPVRLRSVTPFRFVCILYSRANYSLFLYFSKASTVNLHLLASSKARYVKKE